MKTIANIFKALLVSAMFFLLMACAFNAILSTPKNSTTTSFATASDCLTFSSDSDFTIVAQKMWNGTLEYSTDGETWIEYAGNTVITAVETNNTYYIYIRGTNNTIMSNRYAWAITGSNVNCAGNYSC